MMRAVATARHHPRRVNRRITCMSSQAAAGSGAAGLFYGLADIAPPGYPGGLVWNATLTSSRLSPSHGALSAPAVHPALSLGPGFGSKIPATRVIEQVAVNNLNALMGNILWREQKSRPAVAARVEHASHPLRVMPRRTGAAWLDTGGPLGTTARPVVRLSRSSEVWRWRSSGR
jgi:hypothetical protein